MLKSVKQTWSAISRSLGLVLTLTLTSMLAAPPATAQDYPDRQITVILANAAGSQPDTIIRLLQPKLQELLGQLIVVEPKTGAAGTIAAHDVATATPDGYTILFTTGSPITRNPFLQKDFPFDPIADLAPITRTSEVHAMLVAAPNAPFNSIEELIAYAREHPGEVTFSSAGVGSSGHVVGELLNREAGIETVHVPYSGGAEIVNAVLGGHVTMTYAAVPVVAPHVQAGTLKVIASADYQRAPAYPDVPAINETHPGVQVTSWHAFYAPGGTPPEVVNKLAEAIRTALADPQIKEQLEGLGVVVVASTPEELGEWSTNEYNSLKDVIGELGIEPQ